MIPRWYQTQLDHDICTAWSQGARNVLAVCPVGSGKTFTVAGIINKHAGAVCAIAHRRELIEQISLTLAHYGVRHSILAPEATIKWIINLHHAELGRSFYDPRSHTAVVSVDTLVRRAESMKQWCSRVSLWFTDEAHHLLRENKWGKAVALFPQAHGLGVTATPFRSDGKGLGRHAHGVFDALVEGPKMRQLINEGFLCEYKIFKPQTDLNLKGVNITRSGDYSHSQLVTRVHKSHIVGDVVKHYLKFAPGLLTVCFATDVKTATEIAASFREAGVKAEVVTAKTPPAARVDIIRRFKLREILVLVNVALFDEGFDCPAIEAIIDAQPTESARCYIQKFGRLLRTMDGKFIGVYIDPVGNIWRHGPPDRHREYTLGAREGSGRKAVDPDLIPTKACKQCTAVFEAIYKVCPYCGTVIIPGDRSQPQFVDGDLTELGGEELQALYGERDRIDGAPRISRDDNLIGRGIAKQHRLRQEAQVDLRAAISLWAGYQRYYSRPDPESYRRFYFRYGVDVMTAQTLGRRDAENLTERVRRDLPCCETA